MADQSFLDQYVINPVQNAFTSLTKGSDLSGLPYSAQEAALAKRQKMAELLMQQGQQQPEVLTYKGIAAQPSVAGGLGKALSQFMGAYMGGKAEEDLATAKAKEDKAVGDIYTKLFTKTPETSQAAYYLPPDQKDSADIGQYVPEKTTMGHYPTVDEQMAIVFPEMAQHGQLKDLGQTLIKASIEARNKENKYSTNLVYDKDGQAYQVSETGGPPRPVAGITARDQWSMGMTPNQKAQYDLDAANYGIRYAEAQLAQNRGAFEGVGTPGMGGITPPSALRTPGASPVAPTTAPATQPTAQAQPSGNVPGAMPRTAAPSQVVRPPTKPSAASAEIPLTDPRNPVYRGMAPKNVQENITKLNLERATAVPQINGQLATLYNLRNTVDNLSTHRGLPNILGVVNQFSQTDTKPETISARSLYDQLFSQTAISQLQAMRDASKTGGAVGQVTEAEWDKLSNAALAMNPKQSPEDFKTALANYKNTLNQIEDKLRGTYKSTYGGNIDFTPPKYKTYEQSHTAVNAKGAKFLGFETTASTP